VLVGRDVLILDEAAGDHVVASMPSLGTRWPAHATSTGKVLLAHLPDAALDSLLETPLEAATPRTIIDPVALRRELARVRSRGWALATEELEAGFVAVGAPIWSNRMQGGSGGEVVAAISVGGPRSRLNQERAREIVRSLPAVTGRISARLAAPGNQAPGNAARRSQAPGAHPP
jgi:DNA-binding IclR family transcriptional regulator